MQTSPEQPAPSADGKKQEPAEMMKAFVEQRELEKYFERKKLGLRIYRCNQIPMAVFLDRYCSLELRGKQMFNTYQQKPIDGEWEIKGNCLIKLSRGSTPCDVVSMTENTERCSTRDAIEHLEQKFPKEINKAKMDGMKRRPLSAIPALRSGFTAVPDSALEAMLLKPLTNTDRVYLALCRLVFGWNQQEKVIHIKDICKLTSMHKSNVSRALRALALNDLILRDNSKIIMMLPQTTSPVVSTNNAGGSGYNSIK